MSCKTLAALAISSSLAMVGGHARADDLYVSNYNNYIEKYTPNGTGSVFFSGLQRPWGIASDSAQNIYVANRNGGNIERITAAGVGSTFVNQQSNAPSVMAFDHAGNLYYADSGPSFIMKTASNGIPSIFAEGVLGATGMAFDSAGNLFVSEGTYPSSGSYVMKFTPTGNESYFATGGLNSPAGLAFDAAGNLYVANTGNNTIMKFTPSGVGSVFASTGLNQPTGLAFDSAGNLYAANFGNNTIEEFSTSGTPSVFASTGLNGPLYLTVVTPEPGSLALLGTSTLILMHRRMRRVAHRPGS